MSNLFNTILYIRQIPVSNAILYAIACLYFTSAVDQISGVIQLSQLISLFHRCLSRNAPDLGMHSKYILAEQSHKELTYLVSRTAGRADTHLFSFGPGT
jgi:hypothetical protein